ncbi:MAG: hypothetical protein GX950_01410 [Candidatus Diapherotrites archaeon]|jgi:hypothetical protein|uniref:Uncharacterized protein n=1 Tax=Candidatus Iainarchaeum sp. TaxID=3101447 RepID=A0A7K4BYY4_9ARCH|nr:hypothetical protein [Candidatus Diapherotrites archaeon]
MIKINSKAFFFTFAVILFASTLVFLTQSFSSKSVLDEREIISSYRSTIIPFLNDDIGCDLKNILGFETSVDYNGVVLELRVSDSISKDTNVRTELNNYSLFLDNYFKRNQGHKEIDFSNALDGNYEIFYGDYEEYFTYVNDFDNNSIKLYPNTSYPNTTNVLEKIDLNIFVKDKQLVDYNWYSIESSGAVPVLINYFGDYNTFEISKIINPSASSSLVLEFEDGVVDINFGLIGENSSSFLIDSGINSKIDFSIYSKYVFDKNELPIYFNSNLVVLLPEIEYSSLIGLKK